MLTGDNRFDDGKADGAFRTIGEVAKALGIRQHVLRYWEDQFPQLRPVKRSGGRRYYRPEDVRLVETIDRLVHREGYTLRGARLALEAAAKGRPAERDPAPAPAAAVAPVAMAPVAVTSAAPPVATHAVPADVIARLQAIRRTLVAALEG
ncbi:MAG: MerR family transcriptional regulator [Sphingomonadales bacterium]|nr:MerR family transcriptional regulator [Sphingomonadales bacterium]